MNPYPRFQPALRLSDRDAHALNGLSRRTARFVMRTARDGVSWNCTLIASGTSREPDPDDLLVRLQWEDAQLAISIAPHGLATWLESQMPGLEFFRLPREISMAALDMLLNETLRDSLGGPAVHILGQIPADRPDMIDRLPLAWMFTLHCPDPPVFVQGRLFAETAVLDRLASLTRFMPQIRGPVDVATLCIDVAVPIGRTRLSKADVQSLETGDVVLFDEGMISTDGELWLVLGNAGLRIRPHQGHYIVTQGWTRLMIESDPFRTIGDFEPDKTDELETDDAWTADIDDDLSVSADADMVDAGMRSADSMAGTNGDHTAPSPARPDGSHADGTTSRAHLGSLESVKITLSFELGTRRLSLAELQALQPGEVFNLARPLNDGPVYINANGTLIGYGDLVDIDGRLGVQIARLGPRNELDT